jgi:hypothetical protein
MFCYCDTASTAIGMFFLPVAMRATPTVAQFTGMSANNAPATFLGFYGALNNMLTFNLSVPSGGLTTGGMTQLYVQSSVATGFIDLSAEI